MSASLCVQAEELCIDGALLFREDFGGNDPDDPIVSTTPVPGMSSYYIQVTNLAPQGNTNDMGSGHYLVAKQGYRNSTLTDYSVWHIMDDHTYPGDKTRGYLMEVDGMGGTHAFYETMMDGLCSGTRLTFSAYIANVETAGQYAKWKREGRGTAHPKISFVITDPTTGAELARHNTDTIGHDWSNYPKNWRESAEWQLVGMTFVVPDGINAVKLSIHNNVTAGAGNDFALDDIEVRLCMPPIHVRAANEVCEGETVTLGTELDYPYMVYEAVYYKWWYSPDSLNWREIDYGIDHSQLTIANAWAVNNGWYKVSMGTEGRMDSENCHTTSEPFKLTVKQCEEPLCMDGTLLFREDFGGNDPDDPRVGTMPVPGMTYEQLLTDTWRSMGSGKYLLTKSGYCNGDTSMTNLPKNRSSQWHLQDDHTYPGDKTRGYLLEIDGRGDHSAFYSTTIDGLCAGSKLTFSAYVANVLTWGMYVGSPGRYAYPRLKFVLTDPVTNEELATYDTGDIPFDSAFIGDYACWKQSVEWRLVGMNFTVPTGKNRVKLTIYNNVTGTTGNDFAIDDIEIRLCAPPVTIEGDEEVCENEATRLTANFTNDGTFTEPLGYKWWHYVDGEGWTAIGDYSSTLPLTNIQKSDSGLYRVAVSSLQEIECLNCRVMSEPFRLKVKECVDELCVDGTLLFREDFGGNSPSDPAVSMASVPGMDPSYYNSGNNLGSGHYTLRKEGWHNGIQWHWQDDHTYFGDKTRGYLLEVDGIGGEKPFYSTTIDGLCAGSKLTFSAYVVNVHYAGQLDYFGSRYVYPRMKFVLKDPETGMVLAEKSTGDIQPDWRYGTPETWKYARDNQLSAEWQLIGINFTVPDGVEAIQMYIYNDVEQNGNGNDFALDDIEIHLCAPPVTIEGEAEVCGTESATLTAQFTNDGTFAEPVEYKWWFSPDSVNWTALSETTNVLSKAVVEKADSGWYKVAVSSDGNIENINCRAVSDPFLLNVQTCAPPPCPEMHYATRDTTVCDTLMPFTWHGLLFNKPGSQTILLKDEQGCDSIEIDYTLSTFHCEDFCLEGELLFREDFGGNDAGYSEISCAHVSGIANFYTNACQEVRKHPEYGMSTRNYVLTKKGQGNRQWHVQDDHTYPNDYTRGYFLEVDGYGGTIYKTTVNNLYEGMELTFSAYIANLHDSCVIANMRKNYGYTYPRFKFILKDAESNAELATYTTGNILPDITTPCVLAKSALWQLKGMKYVVPEGVSSIQMLINNDVASYDGNDFGIDDIEIRLCYMPAKKMVQDTIICDTIDNIVWRNKIYPLKNELRDTVYDSSGADSIYYILNIIMEHCCPEIKEKTITIGTLCDTLLPYTLYFRDTVLTFKMAGDILLEIQHPQWDCIDSIYTLHLDTIHCERLYDIIVNKYNWQLLCDNVALRNFFPGQTATAFQWYKNDAPIPGATDDDYSEQNILNGRFQLRITLDGGEDIWSNILEIVHPEEEEPLHVRIYDSRGREVREECMHQGVYLFHYQQGDRSWTEKRLIR